MCECVFACVCVIGERKRDEQVKEPNFLFITCCCLFFLPYLERGRRMEEGGLYQKMHRARMLAKKENPM